MAVKPEIIATINALTATNSSVQGLPASSGKKLTGALVINASTNTATCSLQHGTAAYTVGSSSFFTSKITGGQYARDSWELPGANDPDASGMNIESGVSLRRLAGQPIVILFTRKD